MALRDQPYIPLYVKDWLTDEKLKECSASSIGVYQYIMCAMHKSKEYGTILLKQKNKQTNDQIENFALKLQKHMHFSLTEIHDALTELIYEDVIQLDSENDKILQKRMIKDNKLSVIRSESGSKGGKKTQLALAKVKANTVNANVSENVVVNASLSQASLTLSNLFIDLIKKENPIHSFHTSNDVWMEKKANKWSEDIDKMIRLDKRTEQDIEAVIKFATSDDFWKGNILSASKLRKQFDQLYVKMKTPKKEDIYV